MVADGVALENSRGKITHIVPREHGYFSCCLISNQTSEAVRLYDDDDGVTALMHAVRNDHETCAQVLIGTGASVNAQDNSGRTALMYASRHDNPSICRILVDNKADMDIQDNTGKTALMHACEMGSSQLCQLLVSYQCDVDKQDVQGKTALMYTIRSQTAPAYYFLCGSKANVDIQDENGMTALMYAARDGWDLCGALVNRNTNLNLRDNNGRTSLMHAASMFHLKPCQLLLRNNTDLALRDHGGMTALMHVICKMLRYPTLYNDKVTDALNVAEALINNGADMIFEKTFVSVLQMESRSKCGLTLGDLIKSGHIGLVRFLICNGIMDAEFIHPTPGQRPLKSVLECAASFERHELLVYCFDKCYLTNHDLNYIRRVAMDRPHNTSKYIGQEQEVSRKTDSFKVTFETKCILQGAASHVWPLAKLAFIALTSALGASPGRSDRIGQISLPPKFKRMLMFQEDSKPLIKFETR